MSTLGGIHTATTGGRFLRRYFSVRRGGIEGFAGIGFAARPGVFSQFSFVGTGISYPSLGVF